MLVHQKSIRAAEIPGVDLGVKRSLRARYSAVDSAVIDLINFA